MNTRNNSRNCGDSLARPYVNNQEFSKMYNLSKSLEYGTIFPELNLWESAMYNNNLYRSIKRSKGGKR